jgi:A1 cistron-splicing factor AAR2
LALTSSAIVPTLSEFYVTLLSLLKLQLEHCALAEGGLFDLADESGSLLKHLLHKFKLGLRDVSGMGKADVMDELDELENYLRGEHGWELDSGNLLKKGLLDLEDGERVEMDVVGFEEEDESGEYAPAVVELTEAQMAELGITRADLRKLGGQIESEGSVDSEDDRDLEDMDDRY